jgi:hypothetical protein
MRSFKTATRITHYIYICSRDLHLRAGSLKIHLFHSFLKQISLKIHLFHSFLKQIFNKNDK